MANGDRCALIVHYPVSTKHPKRYGFSFVGIINTACPRVRVPVISSSRVVWSHIMSVIQKLSLNHHVTIHFLLHPSSAADLVGHKETDHPFFQPLVPCPTTPTYSTTSVTFFFVIPAACSTAAVCCATTEGKVVPSSGSSSRHQEVQPGDIYLQRGLLAATKMVWCRRKVLLPGLAIIAMAVVGFMSLARRDGVSRPTQLRADQQTLSQSPSFEPGVKEIGEASVDDSGKLSEKPTEADQVLAVGGRPRLRFLR